MQVSTQPTQLTAITTRQTCRLCESASFTRVWSFGPTPLANNYLLPSAIGQPELMAPLDVYYCNNCHLVQLRDVVHPDLLFKHYLYVSSTSTSFVRHFEEYADQLIQRFHLTSQSLVIDVGSNDGILLSPLQKAGLRILGIDPAENVAAQANAAGFPTIAKYFTPQVADSIQASHGSADIISANNVFAHTDDINNFIIATKRLLAKTGVFTFEVQYLKDLVEKNLFDIVYHEHVNYYHLTPLVSYFNQHGMEVFDVQRLPVHGGSIRVFVQHINGPHSKTERLSDLLQAEEAEGFNTPTPYQQLATRVAKNKETLRTLLTHLKQTGQHIAGYGAPAKATTLSYAFGLTKNDLDFIVDDAPLKQGRLMPGTHIPIVDPSALYGNNLPAEAEKQPDYCLILAWNFAESIMQNHQAFTAHGKFIVPVPNPRII